MSAPDISQSIEHARALIAQRRTSQARKVLEPLRGIPAIAGPVEMLVAYSFLLDVKTPDALAALRRVPNRIEPGIALAVGRLLLSCDAPALALDRFQRLLAQHPALPDAVAGMAEAAGLAGRPAAALAWAERARILGAQSPGLPVAQLQALVDLGRIADAARRLVAFERSGDDVDAIISTFVHRLLNADGRAGDVDRLMSALPDEALRRPRLARPAAAAAYFAGEPERAAALLDGAGWAHPAGIGLRHEIALDQGDAATAARAADEARKRVLATPDDPDATIDLIVLSLRTVDHDSAAVLRRTGWGTCQIGTGLQAGPDMLFKECVRLKNDMAQRVNSRGPKLAHALGALAAEATFGHKVAVRNGSTHARISIAGRELSLRLTSSQIRRTTDVLFALEPGMLRWFASFAPTDVLVDVGANIGMFTVLAAGISGCRVIAIEPFSLNVADLEHNVALNGLQDRVTVMHAAATDRERIDTLYFGQSHAGAANQSFGRDDISEQYEDRDADRETVRGVPLDVLVARGEIPFPAHVKIDVDGLEEPVIEGMRGILGDPRFKSLRMEIRWLEEERQAFVDSILAQGFSVSIADDVKNLLFVRLPTR